MSYVTGKQALRYRFEFLDWVHALKGFRRAVLIFVLGAVSVLALPPFHLWPILFATFPLFLSIASHTADTLDKPSPSNKTTLFSGFKTAGTVGWLFGFGYFVAGFYWFGHAFLVEAEQFALLMPLAVVAMPAFLGLFYGAATGFLAFTGQSPAVRLLVLTSGFGLLEWLRGHILTGFPWNAIGYTLTSNDILLQSASLFGVYGLNFIAVFVFASPFLLFSGSATDRTARICLFFIAGLMLTSMMGWGLYRLDTSPTVYRDNILLRIVQPNIPQKEKMEPHKYLRQNFDTLLELSKQGPDKSNLEDVTHVIWPEVALRADLPNEEEALKIIGEMLPPKTQLLTGTLRVERPPNADPYAFNSLIAINDLGFVTAAYDKVHLVPFGEYLPFQPWLEAIGLQQLTRQRGGFAVGRNSRRMSLSGLPPFTALICYEIIFPDNLIDDKGRTSWLLNITNDAWFGHSTGPYQHLLQSRVRAVEEGLPVVRVANTGISAVVDSHGRVLRKLDLGVQGVFDTRLPKETGETFYAQNRMLILPIFLLILLLSTILISFIYSNKRSKQE